MTLTIRGSTPSVHNSGTEIQLNIPAERQAGDLLVYWVTMRRPDDPGVNAPAGWDVQIDDGGAGSTWVAVFTKESDGSETDTTFTVDLTLDAQGADGLCAVVAAPSAGFVWTIDVSTLQLTTAQTDTVTFPTVTLTGGSRRYLMFGSLHMVDPTGNYDIIDYAGMTQLGIPAGGSGETRLNVAYETVTTSDTYTPSDWTADMVNPDNNDFFTSVLAIHDVSSNNRIGGAGAIARPPGSRRPGNGGGGGGTPVGGGPGGGGPPTSPPGPPTQPPGGGPPPTTDPRPDDPLGYPPEVPVLDGDDIVLPGDDDEG